MANVTTEKLLGWAVAALGALILYMLASIDKQIDNNYKQSFNNSIKLAEIDTTVDQMNSRLKSFEDKEDRLSVVTASLMEVGDGKPN